MRRVTNGAYFKIIYFLELPLSETRVEKINVEKC